MIVTLSGTDCSGKSTQLDLLEAAAFRRNLPVRRLWHRGGYSAEAETLKQLVRRCRPGALPPPGPSAAHTRAFARGGVRRGWIAFASADTLWAYAAKVRAWSMAGNLVLCDRWVWDTRIDLEVRFGLELADHPAWLALEALCPKPDHAFLLLLPESDVQARMQTKGEQMREPAPRRADRLARYERLAGRDLLKVVDARPSIDQVAAAIAREIGW